jgi:RsiW-degrading membrane proteinase PrsW (M82 family)
MRPRKLLRIARWETTKGVGGFDRGVAAVGLAAAALLVSAGVVGLVGGVAIEDGIYRVGVDDDSPFHDPVAEDRALSALDPDSNAIGDGGLQAGEGYDLYIEDDPDTTRIYLARRNGDPTDKSRAAAATLRDAVKSYNERRMREEENGTAAFPVVVTLEFVERDSAVSGDGAGNGTGDGGSDGGGTDGGNGGGSDGGGGGLPSGGGTGDDGGQVGAPSIGAFDLFGTTGTAGSPSEIAPPFPFQSLVLAFVFVLPLNFVIQAYGSSMFARSFKELTFVSVSISTLLTTYAFVPAIFTGTSPVAFVSPLTVAVRDLTGAGVTAGQFLFATGPATLVAGVCFLLGLGVYREEDLFTQRPVHLKALDALAGRVRRPRSLALVVALLVPFVFVAELLAVALLFALPVALSIPLVFGTIAVIEELAKGLPVYAGFVHGRYERSIAVAAAAGAAAGLGFFLAEKLSLVVQVVGLPDVAVADAAFQTGFSTGSPAVVAALALAPLLLHVVTAAVSAIGASRGRAAFVVGLSAAVVLHVLYNLAVVSRLV